MRIFDKDLLLMYMGAQDGVPSHYDTKNIFGQNYLVIEKQSAGFLKDYLNGEISFNDEALELLPMYFRILKHSKYAPIAQNIREAEEKIKLELILKHKDQEKKKAFAQSKFKILNNKKEAAHLSSKDMLMIAELLEADYDYSTEKLKNKIRSFASDKINKVLKGEMPEDDCFQKLVEKVGTYQQKKQAVQLNQRVQKVEQSTSSFAKKKKLSQTAPKAKMSEIQPKASKAPVIHTEEKRTHKKKAAVKKKSGFFKKLWNKVKKPLVVCGITALGFLGIKTANEKFGKSDEALPKNDIETVTKIQTPVNNVEKQQTETKTVDFSKEQEALNQAYKKRFDSSLKIILGEEARDQLYSQIDQLAKEGKIEFKDGTTREWYAHSFTMYDKVAPNSEEAKTIKALLKGEKVNKEVLHDLVIKAKRSGTGIEASGTYSAFDNAAPEVQQQHIKTRKSVKAAEAALIQAKNAQER